MSSSPPARRRSLLALAVTFLALGVAALAAHATPARGFEINIFDATPLTFWVPLGVALVASTYVSVTARSTWAWLGGLVGSASGVLAVAALPLLRGYYFYGPGDAMSHLGWVKDIIAGRLVAAELLYPGLHTISIALSRPTGLPVTRSMLFVVFSFMVLYVVFVPIVVWLLTDRRWLITAGAYAGMLYLTLNQVSMHYMSPHPFSQATHMLPLAVYAFILYLVSQPSHVAVGQRRVTSIGALFALFSLGAVLYHPEHAVNLVLLFGLALVVQLVARRVTFSHRIIEHRSLLPQVSFFAVVTVVWTAIHSRGSGTVERVIRQIAEFVFGRTGAGAVVDQRTGSLVAIGGSVEELFLKLFLVMAIFAGLSGLLILIAGTGLLNADRSDTDAIVLYLSLGLFVLVPASLAVFVGSLSKLFFRNMGTIMAMSTILGVLALAYVPAVAKRFHRLRPVVRRAGDLWSRFGRVRTALVVVVVLMLLTHSIAIMFTSPYIYRPSRGVSDQMMNGHETIFQHQVEGVNVAKLRGGPERYLHAVYGTERLWDDPEIRDEYIGNLSSLQSEFEEPWYVTISDADRLQEVVAYDGLRFNRSEFDSLDAQVGVDRVQDNGGVQSYLVS